MAKRRVARALQQARVECARLAQEESARTQRGTSTGASPLDHLRAAETHLAAVERWLLGGKLAGGEGRRLNGSSTLTSLQAEKLAVELGMAQGLAPKEEQACFADIFTYEDREHELLIAVLACSVKSNSFRYPGKLYLSSNRVCFFSTIMERAIEAQFAIEWNKVGKVRLVESQGSPASSESTYSDSKTNMVRILLKGSVEFDGLEVGKIDVSIFDLASVGLLHRCCSYFVGDGLFGEWQDPNDANVCHRITTARPSSPSSRPSLFRKCSTRLSRSADVTQAATVWELERRTTVFSSDWRAPFLPHDGVKYIKWCAIQDHYVKHPSLPRETDNSHAAVASSSEPPIERIEILGQTRMCKSWKTVVGTDTDDEGWQYAFDFFVDGQYWGPSCTGNCHVRRRQWRPRHTYLAQQVLEVDEVRTTFMEEKGLHEDLEPVFEDSVGNISLETLAAEFESDDWLAPGRLVAALYEGMGAKIIEIGEWSTRKTGMKGKVRSVELHMPVPKGPMCPPTTRVNQTFHAYHDENQVVVEQVNMSLDVPYGTSFTVVMCDTFISEGGATRMSRTVGVEWLQSIWLRHVVEAGVPKEAAAVGRTWSNVIRRWPSG